MTVTTRNTCATVSTLQGSDAPIAAMMSPKKEVKALEAHFALGAGLVLLPHRGHLRRGAQLARQLLRGAEEIMAMTTQSRT